MIMTQEDRQQLQESIVKWHRDAAGEIVLEAEQTYQKCADELEALVRTGGVETPLGQLPVAEFRAILKHIHAPDETMATFEKVAAELAQGAVETPAQEQKAHVREEK